MGTIKEWKKGEGNLRKDIVREQIPCTFQHDVSKREQGKEEDPVLCPQRQDTRKETEKEISKAKEPKVPVRQRSHVNQSVLISRRSNDKRNPHATNGIHQDAHNTNPKVDAQGGTRVYSSIQATAGDENTVKEQFPQHRTRPRNSVVH